MSNKTAGMNPHLPALSMTELMDLLVVKTQQMTQLLSDKQFGDSYEETKRELAELIKEIESRKDGPKNSHGQAN